MGLQWPWSHSGVGDTAFDKPTSVRRVRVTGEYSGRNHLFIVHCGLAQHGGHETVNTIIGTRRSPSSYSGIHDMSSCGEVKITYFGDYSGALPGLFENGAVSWSFTEVQ